jgi:hypothetical protein
MSLGRRARNNGRPLSDVLADLINMEPETLAFPKNPVFPGEGIDYTALAIPKDPPDRERNYLDLVRGELCALSAEYNRECGGVTEAAHLQVLGKGIKASDFLTVPLCSRHHGIQHSLGIATFQLQYGINLWQIATHLLVRWIRQGKKGSK